MTHVHVDHLQMRGRGSNAGNGLLDMGLELTHSFEYEYKS